MMDLKSKRIVLTGGAGFLGRHVREALVGEGVSELVVPRRAQFDLTKEAVGTDSRGQLGL